MVIIIKLNWYYSFSLEIGIFTSAIYDEDCIFEDPTIKFRGWYHFSLTIFCSFATVRKKLNCILFMCECDTISGTTN